MSFCLGKRSDSCQDLTIINDTISLEIIDSESTEAVIETSSKIKTYKYRWFILIVICGINISNTINGFCYTTIADLTGQFYDASYNQVNLLSTISIIIIVPAGLISFVIINYFGIRLSLNLSGWLNFIGSLFCVLSSIEKSNATPLIPVIYKYSLLMTGQVFCSIAAPFAFLVTTKFANSWFTQDERALANTVALISGTFGFLISAILSPFIVNSKTDYVHQMQVLNFINSAISFVPALLATFLTRSTPPTPPTNRENLKDDSKINKLSLAFFTHLRIYFKQVLELLKSLNFILLFITFGFSFGLSNTTAILLQQLLCVHGYTDSEVGIFSGIMVGFGILGSLIAGIIVDRTKKFEETAKICFLSNSFANLLFAIFQSFDNNGIAKYLVLVSFALIGLSGFPIVPVSFIKLINLFFKQF